MDPDPPFSDEVAEGVRVADPDALAAVFRALAGPLHSWLRSQVRDAHFAEDLVEETFLELVRNCRGITGGPQAIRAWVYRAARNNLYDLRRRHWRRPEQLTDTLPEGQAADLSPAEQAVDNDTAAALRIALAALPPNQQEVLTLRYLGDLSGPEVAHVLGKSEGAVRSIQHRGIAALARMIRSGAVPIEAPTAP